MNPANRTLLQKFKPYRFPIALFCTGTGSAAWSCKRKWECDPTWAGKSSLKAKDRVDLSPIRADISSLLDDDDNLGPTLIRLAWHASGTFSCKDGSGGSDGARMRFSPEKDWGANAGLGGARNKLAKIQQKYPGISTADLWILAGAEAIKYMNGPEVPFRLGRSDEKDGSKSPPDGRLPDADKGKIGDTIRHVRAIFNRMGFDDKDIVALLGAHSTGRCHTDASGYSGPWTRAPTSFTNEFYRELLENTWTLKNWSGPDQFEDPSGQLMMLPADMALVWDKNFRKYVELYAKDEQQFFKDFTCAWTKLTEAGCKNLEGKKGWW